MKGKIKEKWGNLTDDDLDVINGVVTSWKARSSSGTASPRIRPERMLTIGSRHCLE